MKKLVLLSIISFVSAGVFAQGKSKEKVKTKQEGVVIKHKTKSHADGTAKASKNIPARVASSFQRDYPGAVNPVWTKYRGDWTVTFGNGLFRSTATYHANGDRRDTQTPLQVNQAPRSVLDEILRRYPKTQINQELLKVERPGKPVFFKFKNSQAGKVTVLSFDENGNVL